MHSSVVRTFLSLDDSESENASSLPQAVEKSLKKISGILEKSSSSTTAAKPPHLSLLEVQIINLESNQLMCKLERVRNLCQFSFHG